MDNDDLKIVVEEGRRQLDRQLADLERTRTRAGTLLTLSLAEIAVLSAGARRVFDHGVVLTCVWATSALLAVLAAGGAISLLTSQAVFQRIDTSYLVLGRRPVLREAALGYAESVGVGEQTIRARITVLRDGVLLAALAAMLYAVVWPFTSGADKPASTPQFTPPSNGVVVLCVPTCTPSSPSQSPGTITTTSQTTTGPGANRGPTPASPTP
ncbi:hypothetical protein ABT369_47240 [Dactylosporangium sp. NPDC000244]|uniref:hypothetical protein n=1 Tax=Dactylosporangium sp. NPDC000244 TaxID=3154365 RepID=UPI003332B8D1